MKNPINGTTQPNYVKFNNDPQTIHDIDLFANGQTNYEYKDVVPLPNGETLAGMFPRGANFKQPAGKQGIIFIRKWYWIWSYYDLLINRLTANFEYKNLPEEIEPYYIENKLNKEGSCAFVKLQNKYIVCNYDIIKKNIYDEPTEIKINIPNQTYNEKKYKTGQFVIIKNNPQQSSTFNDTIQYLERLYQGWESFSKNIMTSQPKGIFLTKAEVDENGVKQPITMSLNSMAEGSNTFYSLALGQAELSLFDSINGRGSPITAKDIFLPLEFTDRTDELIKYIEFLKNNINEQVGLKVNMTLNKKERLNTSEVESNSSPSSDLLELKLLVRQEAIKKINKLFNLNIQLDLKQDEINEEIKEKENNNETSFKLKRRGKKDE